MNVIARQNKNTYVIPELIALLEKMPQGEQHALLNNLGKVFSKLRRRYNRQEIKSEVICFTRYQLNKGLITNISAGGIFIETRMPFHSKDRIKLKFTFPQKIQKQVQIDGQIVRITPNGIGVEFVHLSKEQEILITSYS